MRGPPDFGTGRLTRRAFVAQGVRLTTGFASLASLACSESVPRCFEVELLSTPERALRDAQAYHDRSPHGEARRCAGCHFFRGEAGTGCGRCQILGGPVSASGYCKAWAEAAAPASGAAS